jgi:CBS domain-containing protein
MKVKEIMSRPVITVKADAGIKAAARLLVELGISALPVVDAEGALVGIVSEADMLPIEARPDPRCAHGDAEQ